MPVMLLLPNTSLKYRAQWPALLCTPTALFASGGSQIFEVMWNVVGHIRHIMCFQRTVESFRYLVEKNQSKRHSLAQIECGGLANAYKAHQMQMGILES
jgi:hypothetical protein